MTSKREDTLTTKAVAAMRAAVKNVVDDHRRRGQPLVLWRNDKIVREMPAAAPAVRESGTAYDVDFRKDEGGRMKDE